MTSNWFISKITIWFNWASDSHWLIHIDIKARLFYYYHHISIYLMRCPLSPLSTGPMGQGRLAIRRSWCESVWCESVQCESVQCESVINSMSFSSMWITQAFIKFDVNQFDVIQKDFCQYESGNMNLTMWIAHTPPPPFWWQFFMWKQGPITGPLSISNKNCLSQIPRLW